MVLWAEICSYIGTVSFYRCFAVYSLVYRSCCSFLSLMKLLLYQKNIGTVSYLASWWSKRPTKLAGQDLKSNSAYISGKVWPTFMKGNLVYKEGKHISAACGVPILASFS
ncbi:hypothetical protein L1049_010143 [Liquidambar formosana]|uniref:Uncharacterized protein n=1 Tax=Liquidambar formosana TaxID=63359 RepID=A0AAP0N9Q1_LIQFO